MKMVNVNELIKVPPNRGYHIGQIFIPLQWFPGPEICDEIFETKDYNGITHKVTVKDYIIIKIEKYTNAV